MKPVSTFFILALASLASFALGEDVAIRLLINNGKAVNSNSGSCTLSEVHDIKAALLTAVGGSARRNLRSSSGQTDPSWCSTSCQGYAPGTCSLVHPGCIQHNSLDSGAVPSEVDTVLPESNETIYFTAEQHAKCQTDRQAIIQDVLTDLDWDNGTALTESCKRLLQHKISLACVKIPTAMAA